MNKEKLSTSQKKEALEQSTKIVSTLSKISYQYRRLLSMNCTKYGISPNESGRLLMLYKFGDITTASQMSKAMGVTKSLVSRSVDNLTKKGYITTKHDELDRRVQHISLTESAQELCKKIYAESDDIYLRAVQGLTPRQMKRVAEAMEIMSENFEKM